MKPSVVLLTPAVMEYTWGKKGHASFGGNLLPNCDPARSYAELWFGDHSKAPSTVRLNGKEIPLPEFFRTHQYFLPTCSSGLPFLAKILSIEQALSIQVHPNKAVARRLHQSDPHNYPDDNHKPEIAIALTELELIAGFKSQAEMLRLLEIAGVEELPGNDAKKIIASLYRLSAGEVASLRQEVPEALGNQSLNPEKELFERLCAQSEDSDIGPMVALLMQHRILKRGQGIFIGSGIVHAYLSGDAFECMANSDNVIRAGLTKKFQDVESLLEVADFQSDGGQILECVPGKNGGLAAYLAPAQEFFVETLDSQSSTCVFSASNSATLIVVTSGRLQISLDNFSQIEVAAGQAALVAPEMAGKYSALNANAYLVSTPHGA